MDNNTDNEELWQQIANHLEDLVCEVSRCADALDSLALEPRRNEDEPERERRENHDTKASE